MIIIIIIIFQDLNQYIPGCVLDPAQLNHELEAPESRYRLARAVLQEIPRQVSETRRTILRNIWSGELNASESIQRYLSLFRISDIFKFLKRLYQKNSPFVKQNF